MQEKLEVINSATGAAVITLFGGGVADENIDRILTGVTGWETIDRDYETVDKLTGNGQYVVSTHVGSRNVQITGILFDNLVNRNVTRTLQSLTLSGAAVTIRRTFTPSTGTPRVETISGYMSSVREASFMYGASPSLSVSFNVLCTDPEIAIS